MRKLVKSTLNALASIGLLRKLIPVLDTWHQGYNLGDKSKVGAIGVSYVNMKRQLTPWRWAPKKFSGGAIASLLGLQIIRYYFYNLRYLARWGKGRLAAEGVSSGIVVRPHLLDSESVSEILDFYRNHQEDTLHHYEDFSELVICNTKGPARHTPEYIQLVHQLLHKQGILAHGEDLTGLKLKLFPFISVLHYKSHVDSIEQRDGQNIPHTDVFYPSFKMFVYLNDVDENNGAFRYLKGSNCFSFRHGINAYKDSLKYYIKGGNRQIYPTDAFTDLNQNSYEWYSVAGIPGDAFFFNVQGIHRRGDFLKDQYRERLVMLVDFRQAEVPMQMFAANV
jgi:hypothetical protein